MQQTLETLPKVPGPEEQETLHGRALRDLFFIRILCRRIGDIADFIYTEKKAQRLKVRRQRNLSQIKKTELGHAREISKIGTINTPNRESKATTIGNSLDLRTSGRHESDI